MVTHFEIWATVISAAGVLVNFVLFIVFSLQLAALRKQVTVSERAEQNEDDRARRQATVEFYAATHARRIEFSLTVRAEWPHLESAAQISDAAVVDNDLRRHLVDYLNYYEFLALGVNMGTYDFDTIRRLARGRYINLAADYQTYIRASRERSANSRLWVELEELAARLETAG